jgi:cardiolipin synthase
LIPGLERTDASGASAASHREARRRWLRWLPNALSLIRLALVPVYVMAAWQVVEALRLGGPVAAERVAAVGILLVSGVTDVLDGFIARRWRLETAFGAVIDAAADKLTQVTALSLLTLVGRPAFPHLPLWLLGAVLARDVVLGLGWLTLRNRDGGVPVEHEFHGRLATVLIFVVVLAATAGATEDMLAPVVAVAALAALASAVGYVLRALRHLRGTASAPADGPPA